MSFRDLNPPENQVSTSNRNQTDPLLAAIPLMAFGLLNSHDLAPPPVPRHHHRSPRDRRCHFTRHRPGNESAARHCPEGPAQAAPLPLEKVQAIVATAHRDLAKVRALIEETPLLVNACWDWGDGDFETPLEAAAHTGRREIAEFLLARRARPSIYASAMLGQLDPIKAALALEPTAHEVPGPHGFTLLHCAKQGGERAKPVYDWLVAQGVPEIFSRHLPYTRPAGSALK